VFSFADAVATAAPSVVNINTRKVVERPNPFLEDPFFRHFFGEGLGAAPERRLETSLGSGVIISPQGYILTNNHVIDGADEIQVSLRDGRTTRAKVVGTDPEADLAVLKVEVGKLPVAVLGRSENLREGDVVLAIGNPFGVGQTVTQGIVSATGRNQLGINTFENFIQTDAAINPGNSGGALVNARGELVGINTAIFSRTGGSQGIGFAIPVSLARGVMEQIIERGHVSRGWLGIEIQDLTPELAESFGLRDARGVVVAGVLKGGPADKAGLQPGDVLQKVGSQGVGNVHEALNAIAQSQPGSDVALDGLREGKPLRLRATSGERPTEPIR
jgi:serine protease DegS